MALLIFGLVLFLLPHSVRVFADDWRTATIERLGEVKWKRYFSITSLLGLALIAVGYGMARSAGSPDLYTPPTWARHLAIALVAIAFILLAAGGKGPPNRIRAAVGHPQILGGKVWAFAHLLANGRVVDVVLFGAFLAWAIADYAANRRRDRVIGVKRDPGTMQTTVVTAAVGLVGFVVFALWLHPWLIGVPVMY